MRDYVRLGEIGAKIAEIEGSLADLYAEYEALDAEISASGDGNI